MRGAEREKKAAGKMLALGIEAYDPVNKNFASNWYYSTEPYSQEPQCEWKHIHLGRKACRRRETIYDEGAHRNLTGFDERDGEGRNLCR